MLDDTSKQILSFLKPYALKDSNVRLDYKFISDNLPNLTDNQILSSLDYLNDEDYIKLLKFVGGNCCVYSVKHKGLVYDEFEVKSPQAITTQTFNIKTVNSSALGNNGPVTINNGYNLDEIRALISAKPSEDQHELNKLVDTVEIITENSSSVSKGFLSKFSDVLAKHSDIAIALGSGIIKWLTTN